MFSTPYLIKPFSFERFQEALLGYAEKHHAMKNLDHVRQEDLDVFLLKGEKQHTPTVNLPKGLTEHTLATIVKEVIDWPNTPFSTADLATVTGISRVSVRKYLNFLVEMNLVGVKVVYQEAGRPLHHFQLELDKKGVLKSMIT